MAQPQKKKDNYEELVKLIRQISPGNLQRLLCVLTYFFKLYHQFFKSVFLLVCDITIFANGFHDFCRLDFQLKLAE